MRVTGSIGIVMSLMVLTSCRSTPKDGQALVAYVDEPSSGCQKNISIAGWEYSMLYKPAAYILEKEHVKVHTDYNARMSQLEGTVWFNIKISRSDKSISPLKYQVTSVEQYEQRYQYMMSEAASDITMLYGANTLHPISYAFETNYNLTPEETLVVGFALPDGIKYPEQDFQLTYRDKIFNNGIVKATYRIKDIEPLKKLTYK